VEARQIGERGAAGVAGEGVQVVAAGVAFDEPLDAIGIAVNRDNSLAVEQLSGEVPKAAADLDHPPSQLARHEAALPGEIVLRPGHALLIFNCVSRQMHVPL
jgi:hypothetical protein